MKKILFSTLLILALMAATTGPAFAQESTGISGTVQSVELGTDANGETIVKVTLLNENGETQTVQISLQTAESLGLVTVDPVSGEATVNEEALDTEIVITPEDIIPDDTADEADDPEQDDETKQHPVGSALSDFFSSLFGVDYETIMDVHQDGVGFGVIAQALRMTTQLEGDTDTFLALIEAKQSGDYSGIILADGSTPDNWGDVVKSLKKGDNLGSVMSNRENKEDKKGGPPSSIEKNNNGQGGINGQGQGKEKGNNGKGNDKGNGKGKGKDK